MQNQIKDVRILTSKDYVLEVKDLEYHAPCSIPAHSSTTDILGNVFLRKN